MRIIAFFVTLFLGIYVASFFKSTYKQNQTPCNDSVYAGSGDFQSQTKSFSFKPQKVDTSKNYTKEEALELLGKRVRNLTSNSAKCPKDSSICFNLFVGEKGKVVDMLPGLNQTYLLEIQWDGESRSDIFVSRADKSFSFEIIK